MRQARYTAGGGLPAELSSPSALVGVGAVDEIPAQTTTTTVAITSLKPSRDFFGRIITTQEQQGGGLRKKKDGETETDMKVVMNKKGKGGGVNNQVWVSFNEGFSNAVRKPITIEELMRGF